MYFNENRTNANQFFFGRLSLRNSFSKKPKTLEPLWPLLWAVFRKPAPYCTLGIRRINSINSVVLIVSRPQTTL